MVVQMKKNAVSVADVRKSLERDARDPKYLTTVRDSAQQAKAYVESLRVKVR